MSPSNSPQTSVENRRRHKKSRNGCLVCKQRRVKCDEVHPRCGRCVHGKRPCSYGDRTPNASTSNATPAGLNTTGLADMFAAQAGDLDVGASNPPGGLFTAFHMALLFHATANMDSYMGLDNHAHIVISNALETAHTAPYVLDQLLALSSLHLSATNADTALVFQQQAAALQNRALTLFGGYLDENYKQSFLFAGLLGVHVLRNTLADRMDSLRTFIGSFIEYVYIHRGVRAVIRTRWKDIAESDLKPLLLMIENIDDESLPKGSETTGLRSHLESTSDLSGSTLQACLSALQWIQRLLNFGKSDPSNPNTVRAIISWPVLISEEYTDALYQHRPEAFVVLAYFAAMLHQHRDFWVFGDSGVVLVRMIDAHVGPFWSHALAWPRHVVCRGGEYDTHAVVDNGGQ